MDSTASAERGRSGGRGQAQDAGTLAGRVAGLERELASRQQRVEELERELDQTRVELHEGRGTTEALTRGVAAAQARLEAAGSELSARQSEVERLRADRTRLRELLADARRGADELKEVENERVTRLEGELERVKRSARGQEQELAARSRELASARSSLEEMEPRLRKSKQLAQDRWRQLQELQNTRWWRLRTRLHKIRRWRPFRRKQQEA